MRRLQGFAQKYVRVNRFGSLNKRTVETYAFTKVFTALSFSVFTRSSSRLGFTSIGF